MIGVSEHSSNDSSATAEGGRPRLFLLLVKLKLLPSSSSREEKLKKKKRRELHTRGPYVYINRSGTLKYLDRRRYVDSPLFIVHLGTREDHKDLQSPPFTPVLPFVTTLPRGQPVQRNRDFRCGPTNLPILPALFHLTDGRTDVDAVCTAAPGRFFLT